jgi:predicted PurR-regulated permease PerM
MAQTVADPPTGTREVARTAATRAAVYLAFALILILIWTVGRALLLIFAGLLFGVFLHKLAETMSDRSKLSYRWSLLLAALGIALLLGGAAFLFASRLTSEVDQLSETIPAAVNELTARYGWAEALASSAPDLQEMLTNRSVLSRASGVVSRVFSGITAMYIVAFIGLYLAVTPTIYKQGFLALFPSGKRQRAAQVGGDVVHQLWWWLLARLSSMAVVGVLTWIGLRLLGVPMAFSLALVAALLSFIPNIGPVLAAVPAMLVAFTVSPTMSVYVGLLYLLVQTVESYGITPFLEYKSVYLPPALTLSAQVIMSLLAGVIGLLVASPLTAASIVLVRRLYLDKDAPARSR